MRWSSEQLKTDPILFADFLEAQETGASRVYKPVMDRTKLPQMLEELYIRHTISNTQVSLVQYLQHTGIASIISARSRYKY